MPGGDRTGPLGRGPMTGRGLGRCANNSNTTIRPRRYMTFRRGPGNGRGRTNNRNSSKITRWGRR